LRREKGKWEMENILRSYEDYEEEEEEEEVVVRPLRGTNLPVPWPG